MMVVRNLGGNTRSQPGDGPIAEPLPLVLTMMWPVLMRHEAQYLPQFDKKRRSYLKSHYTCK
jgi:hypothetical protein